MTQSDSEIEASELGTKQYWEKIYNRDSSNFQDFGDIGEVWFGEDVAEDMIDWVTENISDTTSRILDVGCGNGHLLCELARNGFSQLFGVDYSSSAIQLARDVAKKEGFDAIQYETMDVLEFEPKRYFPVDVVLDKGTLDAITLAPTDENNVNHSKRDTTTAKKYAEAVNQMLKPGGVLLITSCNWTETELESFLRPVAFDRIKQPSFTFGGQSGQTVSTVAFRKLE